LLAAEAALNALFSDIISLSDSAAVVTKVDEGAIVSTNIVAEGGIVGTHPTQVLLRLRPGIKFFGEEPEPFNFTTPTGTVTTTPLYHVSVTVDAVKFYGSGASKKLAKARAAAEALQKAFSISCTETPSE
jgi:Double-stranded RNA binding motif